MNICFLIASALIFSSAPLLAGIFVDSPVEAKDKAKNAKTDFIVMAHGGSWDRLGKVYLSKCWNPCIKMIDAASFVSTVEFPQNPDKEEKEKLEKKQKGVKMDLRSLPSVYLFDEKGFCYAVLSGEKLPKSPSSLSATIAALQANRKKRDELTAQGRAVKGPQKAKLLGMAAEIQNINRDPQLLKEIREADPNDKTGYIKRLSFEIWSLHDCLKKPKAEALSILGKELASPFLSIEQKQTIYGLRGTVLRRNKATDQELKENYEKMYSLDPQSLMGKAAVKAMKAYVGNK